MRIKDNSFSFYSDADLNVDENTFSDLSNIANISISQAQENNPELLVFPHSLGAFGDRIGDDFVCSLNGDKNSFKLSTGNIMGFVGYRDTQLSIYSRFTSDKCDRDYFLHYMLQRVFCPNLFNWKHSYSNENIFDFLIYIFPYFLNKALKQGLFKEYKWFQYNESKVKGAIDVSRHIKNNTPFAGKIAYNTREHSYDNRITQLIRHTIEYIGATQNVNAIFADLQTQHNVRVIIDNTPSFSLRNLRKVLADNVKEVHHPYYTSYTLLQKICLQILRHEGLKYGHDDNKIYGILFDGAWLWEEYLATVLKGFIHPRNKERKDSIYLFDNELDNDGDVCTKKHCKRYPDFYKKATNENANDALILDAKYKRLESGSIDRDDMHQIISYMHVERARLGGLIYPLKWNIYSEENIKHTRIGKLRGYGGEIYTYGLHIYESSSENDIYSDFVSKMKSCEDALNKKVLEDCE